MGSVTRVDIAFAIAIIETCEIDSQPTRHDPITHYIVVRPDLPRGVLAAQVVHAAGESSPGNLPSGTYAVVLQAREQALLELEHRLQEAGVRHRAIREEAMSGQLTAIGIEPRRKSELKRLLSSIPLLR
jgi:peptidyl-tRNA hydrolase